MPFIAAGGAILGGLLGGRSAKKAAQIQADAQTRAAQLAAEEARFRPVGITTRFGSSQFQTGPDGRVSGASYELNPEFQAMQDRFLGLAGQGLSQAEMAQQQFAPLGQAAQGLFGLGQQYLSQPADPRLGELAGQFLGPSAGAQALTSLGQQYVAQSPQEAAQQFMSQQQNLLAPSRERQFAQLQNQLFQTGRGGLSVGATGERPSGAAGLGAASPELEAYYNALAQQDAGLAAQAQQAGQQQTAFGAGLLGQGQALGQGQIGFGADLLGRQQAMEQGRTSFGAGLFGTGGNLLTQGYGGQAAALGPYQAYLQGASGLEALGQDPLNLGSALGGRIANPEGGAALLRGGLSAAGQNQFNANAFNPFATALTQASQNPALRNVTGSGLQAAFSQTALGGSGFGTGLAYGNQDIGAFI
jgi:hypothetical protein